MIEPDDEVFEKPSSAEQSRHGKVLDKSGCDFNRPIRSHVQVDGVKVGGLGYVGGETADQLHRSTFNFEAQGPPQVGTK